MNKLQKLTSWFGGAVFILLYLGGSLELACWLTSYNRDMGTETVLWHKANGVWLLIHIAVVCATTLGFLFSALKKVKDGS